MRYIGGFRKSFRWCVTACLFVDVCCCVIAKCRFVPTAWLLRTLPRSQNGQLSSVLCRPYWQTFLTQCCVYRELSIIICAYRCKRIFRDRDLALPKTHPMQMRDRPAEVDVRPLPKVPRNVACALTDLKNHGERVSSRLLKPTTFVFVLH